MAKETLTRRELFELVWNEPMTKVAARYGMSDVGLKKLCERSNVHLCLAGVGRSSCTV